MANKLIIVESPTKVHTISKFLGNSYKVVASQGHVRDLPKSQLGVDLEHDFEPKYITIRGKGELLSALKAEVKKADKIYLATDPDREGEAISWHLKNAIPMAGKEVRRITFNEITEKAVKEAIKAPKDINLKLVDAQQARRVMDRVVGYQISPILWKKVKSKLSAGRVQSAVLRMICDREEEVNAFIPKEYWTLSADFSRPDEKKTFEASFYGTKKEKLPLESEEDVLKAEQGLKKADFTVSEVKHSTRVKNAPFPFTTSTLQQDAANRLNFSTSKTMRLAQELYEGVKITGRGTIGLITYLRTDSTRISEDADKACKAFVAREYGEAFVGQGTVSGAKEHVQDAHEAIRPTFVDLTPEQVKNDLSRDLFRLYQLIFKRFVASRMKTAVYDTVSAKISAGDYIFTASASRLSFAGFLSVYGGDDEKSTNTALFEAKENESLKLSGLEKEQHFTQAPPHFTESTLVRAMEENGLGRPSTYAPTIANILAKHYIAKEGRNIVVTELGEVVNGIMMKSFPDIVDLKFTADMEEKLDRVEEGTENWRDVMHAFYPNFEQELKKAEAELEHVTVEDEKTDVICDLCGRNMVIKYGRHGKFLACPGFPECRNTKPYLEYAGAACPTCGKQIIICRTKKGRRFYACEDQACDYMSWSKPKTES